MSRAIPYRPDVQTATSSSYDKDGFLSVGVDGEGAATKLQPVEAVPPLGIFARPLDPGQGTPGSPLAGQSCTVLRLTGDNDDFVVPLTDPRVVGLLPQLGKGAVCVYEPTNVDADGATSVTDLARLTINDDGNHRIVIHAPASAAPTKIVIEIAGGPTVTVDGTATPPNVTVEAGGTLLVVDSTGVQAGALGGIAGLLGNTAFLGWLVAVGAATGAGAPPGVSLATKFKAT